MLGRRDIAQRFSVFAICDADCYLMLVRVERGCPPPGPFTRTLHFVTPAEAEPGGRVGVWRRFTGVLPNAADKAREGG